MYLFTQLRVLSKKKSPLILLLCLQFLLMQVSAGQPVRLDQISTPVTLIVENTSLDQILMKLNGQGGYRYIYDNAHAERVKISAIHLKEVALGKILQKLKNEVPLSYSFDGKSIMVRIEEKAPSEKQNPGKITGKVLDEKGETLPGASIRILENNRSLQTGVDGSYVLNLPAGVYTLEVSFVSYQKQRITDIVVNAGGNTKLDIAMKPASNALAEVVVTANYQKASIEGLYAAQKNSASTTDGITREQIVRTPDNNVAQVLSRVSGMNVQEEKFVTVRGLSDRYNNVMLNGSQLPSTEPNRRNFAFDIIPSAMIDNVVVNKTATPDLPGEFTGGIVQVTTRDIPESNFIRFKVGSGFNSKATGKSFYQPVRGKYDFLGFDDGGRRLPDSYNQQEYYQLSRVQADNNDPNNAAARQRIAQVSSEFPDRLRLYDYTGMPVQDYEFNLGRTKLFNNQSKLGGIFALTYRNDQTSQDYTDDAPPEFHKYFGSQYNFNTTVSGLLNAGYSFGKNKISIRNIFTQKLNENSFIYQGINYDNSTFLDAYAHFPLINTLMQNRLEGEHAIGERGFKLNWHGGFALTHRDEPDNIRVQGSKPGYYENNQPDPDIPYQYAFRSDYLSNVSNYFSEYDENRYTWSLDAQQPFKAFNLQHTFKLGYQGSYREADFEAQRFTTYPVPGQEGVINRVLGLPYYEALGQENFGETGFFHLPILASQNSGNATRVNGYEGFQRLHSFYGMVDGHVLENLRLIAGVRAERNEIYSETAILSADDGSARDSLLGFNKTNFLPSANLIYSLTPKINVRASYYQTLARPDIRELSFFQYFEPQINAFTFGNNLRPTDIDNADLRFEYYPSPQEIISISAFYKKFKDPIELQAINSYSNPSRIYQYQYLNLSSAKDFGIELNFRKSLGFIASSAFLDDLYLSGNFTWIDASVFLGQDDILRETIYNEPDGNGGTNPIPATLIFPGQQDRPLYGQAPYIINGGLLYTGKHFGFNFSYNRTGERIVFGAQEDVYNEWEKARDVLDAQISYRFFKGNRAELKINFADILNQPVIRYYNNYKQFRSADSGQVAPDENGIITIPEDPSGNRYDERYDFLRRSFNLGRNISFSLSYTL